MYRNPKYDFRKQISFSEVIFLLILDYVKTRKFILPADFFVRINRRKTGIWYGVFRYEIVNLGKKIIWSDSPYLVLFELDVLRKKVRYFLVNIHIIIVG